jgi:hypothetical protein
VIYVQNTGVVPVAGNGLATASMVVGICSIPLVCCCYLGIPVGIVAIILGAIGLSRANQLNGLNRSYAIAGMATGAAPIVLSIVILIISIASGVTVPVYTPGTAPTF